MAQARSTIWRLVGDEVATCNCDWGCPCQFNALPTHGRCEGVAGFHVREGHYGSVRLDNVYYAEIYSFPGAVHQGNGALQLIIDDQTSQAQREALRAIVSGVEGGMPFEVFAAMTSRMPEPIVAPIALNFDRKRRTANVSIGGIAASRIEPIKNPVTGEEHHARIVLPEGFEFKEAEMANAASIRAGAGAPFVFEYSGTYAQLNGFDWTNESRT